MVREYLISPDGNAVAVRTDQADPEAWNAWGVIHAQHGGHWSATAELFGWTVAEATEETLLEPEPESPLAEPPQ